MATRATIRARARVKADHDASTFPTDAQYNDIIDEAGRDVWFDMLQAGWPVRFTTVTLNPTGQFTSLGVGTAAFVRGVYRQDGGQFTEMRRLNEGDRASLLSTVGNKPEYYCALLDGAGGGSVLELLPPPVSGSGTFVVHYIVEWPGFSSDSDTWPGPVRSDQLVVLRAAIEGCGKEDNDPAIVRLERQYERVWNKVIQLIGAFDLRNPPIIRDSDPLRQSGRDAFDYNASGLY